MDLMRLTKRSVEVVRALLLYSVLYATFGVCAQTAPQPQLPWVRRQGHIRAKGVIIFVHGVLGDARSTWQSGSVYWPDLLTRDKAFDGQDIYVFQYPSPKGGRSLSIDEVAEHLRLMLETDGVLEYKSVSFVSHSMGGIVTRSFITKYQSRIVSKIRLLYFYATPTTGSPYAVLASLVRKNPQLWQLHPMNADSYLGPVQSNWLAGKFGLRSYCAFETLPLFGQIIVSRESATNLCTEPLDPIYANHVDIVKPAGLDSTIHRTLRAAFNQTADPRVSRAASETPSRVQVRAPTPYKSKPYPAISEPTGNISNRMHHEPAAESVPSGGVVSVGQLGGITAAQVNVNLEPPANPPVPQISIQTSEGLNVSDFLPNRSISSDMVRDYRRHRLTLSNVGSVDLDNVMVRFQLPEPVIESLIIEERPAGVEIQWHPCRLSMQLIGEGASATPTRTGGVSISTAPASGASAALVSTREICSPEMSRPGRPTNVYKLTVSRLPAGLSIGAAFHTSSPELPSGKSTDTDVVDYYADGIYQFHTRGQTVTRRLFTPLQFSAEQRRITALPTSGEIGKWRISVMQVH